MERRWQGDYRPEGWFPALRTACHGCRRLTHLHISGDKGIAALRTMVIVGDGDVLRETAPGHIAPEPCQVCGDTDDPGWLPGFLPPV